jgi:amino acid transporter
MGNSNRWFLAAAVLVLAAAWLPYWGFRMSAPQYPDESLTLLVSHSGISGDVQEVETLQKYIGVRFPEDVPELQWLPWAMLGIAVVISVGAFGGAGWLGLALRWAGLALFAALLVFSAAIVQRNLYDVGHHRDPHAPITAIKDFTPRILGPTKVGNFTVWSFPHVGGIALAAAAALMLAGVTRHRVPRGAAA